MPSNRSRSFLGIVRLCPCADPASRLVDAACRVFVAARVDNPEIPRQAEEQAKLFETQVGTGQMSAPAPGVGRFDQALQHVECGGLDTVAEQELLTAGKTFHRRNEPQDEAVVRLQGRAGAATRDQAAPGGRYSVPPRSRLTPPPTPRRAKVPKSRPRGLRPLGTPRT